MPLPPKPSRGLLLAGPHRDRFRPLADANYGFPFVAAFDVSPLSAIALICAEIARGSRSPQINRLQPIHGWEIIAAVQLRSAIIKPLVRHRHEQQIEEPTPKPQYTTQGPTIDIIPDVNAFALIPIYDPKEKQKLMEELDKICELLFRSLKKQASNK